MLATFLDKYSLPTHLHTTQFDLTGSSSNFHNSSFLSIPADSSMRCSKGYRRTWVCEWHRRSWSVSQSVADRWNGKNGERTTGSDNDRVEDGWLLNGGPVEVFQRLLEEAWGGHCDLDVGG